MQVRGIWNVKMKKNNQKKQRDDNWQNPPTYILWPDVIYMKGQNVLLPNWSNSHRPGVPLGGEGGDQREDYDEDEDGQTDGDPNLFLHWKRHKTID